MNWNIFIVGHNNFHERMYKDPDFSEKNFSFINAKENKEIAFDPHVVINQYSLENSIKLGPWWAESEVIYNIYRSNLYFKYDYIGFLHYDIELRLRNIQRLPFYSNRIVSKINSYLLDKSKAHISFETYDFLDDYNQKIMADIDRPDLLTGDGLNAYEYIFDDYNDFFGTSFKTQDFFGKKINLCSCFLVDVKGFEEMMLFWDFVINKKEINIFDSTHQNRIQGGLAERYFGVYLMINYDKHKDLTLIHHYNSGLK